MRIKIILVATYLIGLLACQNNAVQSDEQQRNTNATSKVQALILTQPFDFDPNKKEQIKSAYMAKSKITVPHNLTPQNKWFMFEGPILENDKIAFRYYADSRHRFDIYGKTVSDLVMDTVGWDYHDIMNWGSDILKVGNSLGSGSPAIWYKDSIYTLSDCDSKTVEIIKSETDVATIQTVFKGLEIEDQIFDLIQNQSIAAGESWTTVQLQLPSGKLPEGMYFATGIVKHLPDIETGTTENGFFATNWGQQSFHKENMGMAICANKKYEPTLAPDELSHAFYFKNTPTEVTYKVVAAWERDVSNIKNESDFKEVVINAATL